MVLVLAAGVGCGDSNESGSGGSAATSASTGESSTSTGAGGNGGGLFTGSGGMATTGSGGMATTGSGGAPATGSGGMGTTSSSASTGTFMGSPCAGSVCDITFNAMGFTMDNGKMLHAGVIQQGGKPGLDWQDAAAVAGGAVTLMGTGVLKKGTAYNLNYYIDLNMDGKCEITPTDEVYRVSIPIVQDNVIVTVTPNMAQSNFGCGGF